MIDRLMGKKLIFFWYKFDTAAIIDEDVVV